MELRHLVLIFVASMATAQESVRHYALDPQVVVTIELATDAPTTCMFPGPLTALEGAGIDTDPAGQAPVLLSHHEGSAYLSLRAKTPEARAGLNVLHRGQVYALRLIGSETPDRAVIFHAAHNEAEGLIQRAQTERWRNHPAGAAPVEPVRPGRVTHYREFSVTLVALYRYDDANALVCHLQLENPGQAGVTYDPDGLGLRLDRQVWFASETEASGAIPPAGTAEAWMVIRADLKPNAPFSVIVPAP
jgi:hypothetical protein